MQRILIFVAVLYLAWRLLAAWGRRISGPGRGADEFSRFSKKRRGPRAGGDESGPTNDELVQCETCGTYVPDSKAVTGSEPVVFCSHSCAAVSERSNEP